MSIAEHFNKEAFDFIPRTFVLPQDYNQFKNYLTISGKNAVFIAKPAQGSQGDDIRLFRDLRELGSKKYQDTVVQKYINNPFLVNGLKFDFRFYIILTGIYEDKVHAFLANEAIVRFCTEKYEKAEPSNFKNIFMHLTNYSINKLSKKYKNDLQV